MAGGPGLAALIWAPNVIWQATHGWPEVAMASTLHQDNISQADYLAVLPLQLVYAGLLVTPLLIAGLVRLWRTPELRFLAITSTLLILYVTIWASDRVVLVVDDMARLRHYFAACRLLTTFYVPDRVPSNFTGLAIGVCTGPVAGWPTLWPHLKHYD